MTQSTCTIDGCDRNVRVISRGLCSLHYNRFLRHGDANRGPSTIAERFWKKVRKADGCWLWTGTTDRHGYGRLRNDPAGFIRAHRYSYEDAHGPIPEGLVIDHMCHNPSCVNPQHLRAVTQKQNCENRQGPQGNNVDSGVRGVYKSDNKWAVRLGHNGKLLYFGRYASIEEAEAVAIEARRRLFTHSQN